MNIIIYANCQGVGIKYFLSKHEKFQNLNIKHIRVDELINKREDIVHDVFKKADILIYQIIDEKHEKYSSDNILKYINDKCIKISFPYIYNNSFYPFKGPIIINDSHKKKLTKIIFDNSEKITNIIDENKTLDEIIHLYIENKIDFDYNERFKNTMRILMEKEKKTDIKVSAFIINNYKDYPLFMLENHPTDYIFVYVVNRISNILDYTELCDIELGINSCKLGGGILPIDNSSKEYYNFNFNIDRYNPENADEYYIKIIRNIYDHYKECTN